MEKRFAPNANWIDEWQPYLNIIPEEKLISDKVGTNAVESNNSSTRHWF